MKKLLLVLLFIPLVSFGQNYCDVYGKISFVSAGEDYKIKYVSVGEDLEVRFVSGNNFKEGQWSETSVGADFKIKVVTVGEDFKVRRVSVGEGCGGGMKSNVDLGEAAKTAYSNQNKLDGVSDDTYDELGDAAGQIASIILIKKAEKKHYKYIDEYKTNPSIENAFEIEKAGRKAIYLTENTAKMINSSSIDKDYSSDFKGATNIKDKWGNISEEHKLIIEQHKTFKKYKKYLKKN
tara:strand:- start:121 stop:828 length:708 start_codon:yes stop_codon:yes gene_type:complete